MALRVLIADGHVVERQALKVLLERHGLTVVAEASDGGAAVAGAKKLAPDVVVLDIAMPVLSGVEAAREITRLAPRTHVILLTALDDARLVPEALHAGVRGFVLKTQGAEDLLQAIAEVSRGRLYLSTGASQAVVDVLRGGGASAGVRLTSRERQVIKLVAEGKSTKQIADLLKISVKTAEFHRGRVMAKLQIHSTAGLVRYAIREGLVAP